MADQHAEPQGAKDLARLSLLALGVVYGDIGTSPLYALRECFQGIHSVEVARGNVLGALSLILWSLVIVISIKYIVFVLRADNKGEGGILALASLLGPSRLKMGRRRWLLVSMGIFGAALLYGDGMITPAISVLSAVEGLEVATPALGSWVIPITIAILVGLFMIQRHGTAIVGAIFGPVTLVWFVVLAVLGAMGIARSPDVLAAVSPTYAVSFFVENGLRGYAVLGSVFLVVTGGEALYADMGHFGPRPIRVAWFTVALPALLLNYFGQGAYLISHPDPQANTFYALAPSWALYPLVVLATMATVIASQAVISGVFSLTMQAAQLGYIPRVRVTHTSKEQFGQIYIAPMNWVLLAATVGLVLAFESSSNLAAAYGVAVTLTMVITTLLLVEVMRTRWKWSAPFAYGLGGAFLVVDLAFFGANITKVNEGGWFPLAVGAVMFTLATTWKRGRAILGRRVRERLMPVQAFLESLERDPPTRVRGTAVFMTGNPNAAPMALVHNLKHNKTLHERVVLLTISFEEDAHVARSERVEVTDYSSGFHAIVAHYGFMEEPDVPRLLARDVPEEVRVDAREATFFLGRETLLATKGRGMARWRKWVFSMMSRLSTPATMFYRIPPDRVIEVGSLMEL